MKRPSLRDFERSYDRAVALKENGADVTSEAWMNVITAAQAFIASLNSEGWTFSGRHSELSQDMRELGDLAMALAVAGQIAKNKHHHHQALAKALLKVIDS